MFQLRLTFDASTFLFINFKLAVLQKTTRLKSKWPQMRISYYWLKALQENIKNQKSDIKLKHKEIGGNGYNCKGMKKTEECQLRRVRTLNSHLDFSINAPPEQECSQKHAEPHSISKKNCQHSYKKQHRFSIWGAKVCIFPCRQPRLALKLSFPASESLSQLLWL